MEMEGATPIIIIIALIVGFVVVVGGSIALTTTAPTPTPTPTIIPTPTPTPVPTPSPTPEPEEGAYPDAHGDYLYDVTSNTDTINSSATPTPIPANILEAQRLGWNPTCGSVEDYIYAYNLAHGYLEPPPMLSLQILNDNKQPWNWQQETVAPGQIISGYYRINNLADYPYQGEVAVYINASLYYNNGLVHMENKLVSLFVSITPHNYNEAWLSWMVPTDISTGVYEIILELREKEHGTTLASYRMTPTVARVDKGGYKYF